MASHEYMESHEAFQFMNRREAAAGEKEQADAQRRDDVLREVLEAPPVPEIENMSPQERSRRFVEWMEKRAKKEAEDRGLVVLEAKEDMNRLPALLAKQMADTARISERWATLKDIKLRKLAANTRHFIDFMAACELSIAEIVARAQRTDVEKGMSPSMDALLDTIWAVHRDFFYHWLSNRRWHRTLSIKHRNLHWLLLTHMLAACNIERTYELRRRRDLTLERGWPELLEKMDVVEPKLARTSVMALSQDEVLGVLNMLSEAWPRIPYHMVGQYPWLEKKVRHNQRRRRTKEGVLASTPGSVWALLDGIQLRLGMLITHTFIGNERDLDLLFKQQIDPKTKAVHRSCVPAYLNEAWARLEGMMLQLEVLQVEFFRAMGCRGTPALEMPTVPGAVQNLRRWAVKYSQGGMSSQLNTLLSKGLWDIGARPGDRERYQVFMQSSTTGAMALDDGNNTVMSATRLEFNETAKDYSEMAAKDVWDLSPIKPLALDAQYLMTRESLRLAVDGLTTALPLSRWMWELGNSGDTRRMEESEVSLGATMERYFIHVDNVGYMQSHIERCHDRALSPGVPFRAIILHALGSWLLVVPTRIERRKITSSIYVYPDLASAVHAWIKLYEGLNPLLPLLRAAVFRNDYSGANKAKEAASMDVFRPGIVVSNMGKDPVEKKKPVFSDNSDNEFEGDLFDAF